MTILQTEDILNYQVFRQGIEHCVESIAEWTTHGNGCRWLACLNPHSYIVSLDDQTFSTALHAADWLIPDGTGIVLASRLQKGDIEKRITGSDIFEEVHKKLNQMQSSVYFLGATEETLAKIRSRMAVNYPNIRIAGTYSPPFKPSYTHEENLTMISAINSTRPDVLWVGMTAPKQEKWIYENKEHLQVKFAGAIGAVFDFYTGRVKRSHPVLQNLGLEWLPRLMQEPRRLWRRNFISSPKFIMKVIQQRLIIGKIKTMREK